MEETAVLRLVEAAKGVWEKVNSSSGVAEGSVEESIEAVKNNQESTDQPCVCNARVICKSATQDSTPVHIKKNDQIIEISDLSKLNVKDITLEKKFAGCMLKGKCTVTEEDIENQEWYDTSISEDKDNETDELKYQESYMVCTAGPGIIYFVDAGQALKDFIQEIPTEHIEFLKLAQLIKCLEIGNIKNSKNGNYKKDENGKILAIKMQNANDGYVTIGYGHAIQSNEDASKYGFDVIRSIDRFKDFDFSKRNSVEDIDAVIKAQQAYYDSNNQTNPAELSLENAELLLLEEIEVKRGITMSALEELEVDASQFSKNEIDAITSTLYNGNDYMDEESLSNNLIKGSKQDSLNIIKTAVEKGWYAHRGLLRRRLMEFNMFYNNDYTFYDDNELEQLKKDTGYTSE